ncbi:peptidase [Planctomycetales bacterium]|nr:peptidase [Planctomycetales bacterium]
MKTKSRRSFFKKTTGLIAAGLALSSVSNADDEVPTEAVALPSRNEVPVGDTWDLTSLFADDAAWKATLDTVKQRLQEFKIFEGKLIDAETIIACFQLEDALDKDAERVGVYAYLRYTEDLADPKRQEMQGLADTFRGQFREATSFIKPELLSIEETRWNEIIADKRLELYALKLQRIVRQKLYTLSKGEEQLLAMLSDVSHAPSKAFGLLNNADLKFGSITDEAGKTVELSTGSFVVLMHSPDRAVREKAFKQFYAGYKSYENTLGSLLGSSIQTDVFYAKVRKQPSALDAALFNTEIPKNVYENLVKTVNASLPVLHRYYELRRKKMGLDEIRMYDTYIPILSGIKTNYPWDEAVEAVGNALKPLGTEYVETITEGLTTARWCDRYENKGKRSGAFSYGCFSAKPYISINYKPNVIDGLFTLAHEGGHSMHSFYSSRTQPFVYYDYVTFVAEVASTFNEDMLTRYLLKNSLDDKMKAWLINHQIDAIRQTLFRQTMFAEFEQRTHEAAERGESLTTKSLQEIYRQLLAAYFGPKFTLDDELSAECLRVPHFYRAFYVYQYATGISAALALAERVSNGGDKERDDYLKFLSGGSSASPIELLRIAGVDMESPTPIESAMKRFSLLIDELERLI